MNLATRPEGSGPICVGSYDRNSPIDILSGPTAGNSATLKAEDVSVVVQILNVTEHQYTGEIVAFEGHNDYTYQGNKPGDAITFTYDNIFSFSRD